MVKLKTEYLPNLYYSKYQYKASFTLDKQISALDFKKNLRQDEAFVALAGFALKHKDDIRIRTEYKSVSIFSNDFSILEKLRIPIFIMDLRFYQIIPTGSVKLFVNPPKHNFRVYISEKPLSREDAETLKELKNRFNLKFSAGLEHALFLKRWWYTRMFIDYNTEDFLTYGSLVLPGFFKKHHKLDWIGNKYKYI